MKPVSTNLSRLLTIMAVLAITVGAISCGGVAGGGASGGGSIAKKFDLSDANFTVGSKEYTEQLILGQIAIQALEAAGANVDDQTGLAGSATTRKALLSGEIDLYWEYTGTAWITYFGETETITDSRKMYEVVAERDLKDNGIKWLDPAPANNTYAIAVSSKVYEDLGIKTLSDFAQLAEEKPEVATLCGGTEFLTRDDGLPGMEKTYGFEMPSGNISKLDEGLIYQAVDKGDPCAFGEVFTTDGRIEALNLELLEDDKHFAAVYNPAISVREETLKEYPKLADLFAPISEKLDTRTVQKLNADVDLDGQTPEETAEDWLRANGFIE